MAYPTQTKWTPTYRSMFSMGQLIFQQLDALLKTLMEYIPAVRRREGEALMPSWSFLKEFYVKLHATLPLTQQKEFDEEFKEIREDIKLWQIQRGKYKLHIVLPPEQLCDRIDKIYMSLISLQQSIGLGLELEVKENIWRKGRRTLLET